MCVCGPLDSLAQSPSPQGNPRAWCLPGDKSLARIGCEAGTGWQLHLPLHSPPSPAQPSRPHSPLVTTCPLCSHPTVSRTHNPHRFIDTRTRYVHTTQGYTKCWHRYAHTATCTGLQAHTDDTLTYSTQTCTEICMGVHTGTQEQHTQGHVHTDNTACSQLLGHTLCNTHHLSSLPPLLLLVLFLPQLTEWP